MKTIEELRSEMISLRSEIVSTVKAYHKNIPDDWIRSKSTKTLIAWTPAAQEGDVFNYQERYEKLVDDISMVADKIDDD